MTDELNDDLLKVPYKSEHGLSKEEQRWLGEWFGKIVEIQRVQLKTLRTINTALQIIALIVLLTAILAACGALGIRV